MRKRKSKKVKTKTITNNYIYILPSENKPIEVKGKIKIVKEIREWISAFATVVSLIVAVVAIFITIGNYKKDNEEALNIRMYLNKQDYYTVINSKTRKIQLRWILEIENDSKVPVSINECEISRVIRNNYADHMQFIQDYIQEKLKTTSTINIKNEGVNFPFWIQAGQTKHLNVKISTKLPDKVLKILRAKKMLNKKVMYSHINKVLVHNDTDVFGDVLNGFTGIIIDYNTIDFGSKKQVRFNGKNATVRKEDIPPHINYDYLPMYEIKITTSKNTCETSYTTDDDALVDKLVREKLDMLDD